MQIIGLCGRSGSGKSTFCRIAKEFGYEIIDCDKVYNKLVSSRTPCLLEIAQNFGELSIKNGALNRPVLAEIVFEDSEKLALLNKITHKHILQEVERIISTFKNDARVILDAPTLFESGADKLCNYILGIVADDEMCAKRIVKRDNITLEAAYKRLANQYTNEFIIENSNHVIYNLTTEQEFKSSAKRLLETITEVQL